MQVKEALKRIEFRKTDRVNISAVLNQKYYPGIDGLRAISIIIVLSSHIFFGNYYVDQLFDYGKAGVEIFFVISGFLITSLLLKEHVKTGKISLKRFYLRRLFRIAPVSILFLLCLLVLNYFFKLNISTRSFFTALLYLKNLPIKNVDQWYIGHFWSLSVEEQFYFLFPLLLLINQEFAKKASLFFIVLIPILIYCGFNKIGIFYSNKIIHNICFGIIALAGSGTSSILIGCLMSILLFQNKLIIHFNNKFLSSILFVLALLIRTKISPLYIRGFSSEIFGFMIAAVIILNLNNDNYFAKVLNNKILVKIGVLSYSIYMWQQIFLLKQPWGDSFQYGKSVFFNLPILIVVAYLSYNFYEKKFLKLKERFN